MEKDFFTELSENINGLDIAFGFIGLLWLFGTILSLSDMSGPDFIILVVFWAGYCTFYWWIKKKEIKSNWRTVSLVVAALLVGKAAIQVGLSMMLS